MSSTKINNFIFDIYETTFSFQLHSSKKNILQGEQGFLDGVYTEVQMATFVHYHHSHKNKEMFLKEKRKGKWFLYFLYFLFL